MKAKRRITFSGSPCEDDETTTEPPTQAARIVASLEKKLATEVGHTSRGATGLAELLSELLVDYVYVPGRHGGGWWHAHGAGVWKEAIDAPQSLIDDASRALEVYVRGRLTDRLGWLDSMIAPKLTTQLGVVVRKRLLQVVKDHLALRRQLENDLPFQSEVLLKLQQLLVDPNFHSHRDQVNVFAREDAVFSVDPTRCRLEPTRERRAVSELKCVLAAPSMEPTEPAEAWSAPNTERWSTAMQTLGFALVSGLRSRHRLRGGALPHVIQIVEPKGATSALAGALAAACGGYAAVVDAARRLAPSKNALLGKRVVVIQSADGEPVSSPKLVRGILNAVAGSKSWPAIVISSTDRSPLAMKGETVLYLDLRHITSLPTMRQMQSMLLEGFRSLGEPSLEFETRPELQLEFTVPEAVKEIVEAEVEATGVDSCRPLTSKAMGDETIVRERVASFVERLEQRGKELGFLSLTIRQTVVVRFLMAMGFSTSNSTNRLFWWFKRSAGDGDDGDTRGKGLTTVPLVFSTDGNQGRGPGSPERLAQLQD